MVKTNEEMLTELVPAFQPIARRLLEVASQHGYDLRIYSGYRSNEEQAKLYAYGRGSYTYNGLTYVSPAGEKIRTYAQPGQSYHNTRRAFDVVDRVKGFAMNWTPYGELAESLGLVWGGRFKNLIDSTHVEYHGSAEGGNLQPSPRSSNTNEVRGWYREYLERDPENDSVLQNRTKEEFLAGAVIEWQARYHELDRPLSRETTVNLYRTMLLREPHDGDTLEGRHYIEWLVGAIKELHTRIK